MATSYGSGRALAMAPFLRHLNTIPDAAAANHTAADQDFTDPLAIFTNTQFFDIDSGLNTDFQAQPFKVDERGPASSPNGSLSALTPLDFIPDDFNFPDISYPTQAIPPFPDGDLRRLSTSYTGIIPQQQSTSYDTISASLGEKRKRELENAHGSLMTDESSRLVVDEDKRRRNTAASARFRIKKKQREEALVLGAKELSDKVSILEGKIQLLETENKWLKNLIMDKKEDKEEFTRLLKELASKRAEERTAERRDVKPRS